MKNNKTADTVPHNCTYCDYRHGGGPCSDEQVLSSYDTNDCPDFVIGKCFSCALFNQDTDICMEGEAYWPAGCINYKE